IDIGKTIQHLHILLSILKLLTDPPDNFLVVIQNLLPASVIQILGFGSLLPPGAENSLPEAHLRDGHSLQKLCMKKSSLFRFLQLLYLEQKPHTVKILLPYFLLPVILPERQ